MEAASNGVREGLAERVVWRKIEEEEHWRQREEDMQRPQGRSTCEEFDGKFERPEWLEQGEHVGMSHKQGTTEGEVR